MTNIRIVLGDPYGVTGHVELEDGTPVDNVMSADIRIRPGEPVVAYITILLDRLDLLAKLDEVTVIAKNYFRKNLDAFPES